MKKIFSTMAVIMVSAAMFLSCDKKEDSDSTALNLDAFQKGTITGTVYAEQNANVIPPATTVGKPGIGGVTLVFSVDYSEYDQSGAQPSSYTGVKTYTVVTAADGTYSVEIPVPANGSVTADIAYSTITGTYINTTGSTPAQETKYYQAAAGANATVGVHASYTTILDVEYEGVAIPYTK